MGAFAEGETFVEQMCSMWTRLRSVGITRQEYVDIEYCVCCHEHQMTTWHVPGQFHRLFCEIAARIKEAFPRLVVKGNGIYGGTPDHSPSCKSVSPRIGAFEIVFYAYPGAEGIALYSALSSSGWLPSPELVLRKVSLVVRLRFV